MLRRICFRIILLLLSAGLLVLVDYQAGKFYPLVTPVTGRAAVAALLGQQKKVPKPVIFFSIPIYITPTCHITKRSMQPSLTPEDIVAMRFP